MLLITLSILFHVSVSFFENLLKSNQSASFYHSLKYISLTILFCSVILYQIYVIIQLLYLKFSLSYFILNNNHAVIFMTSIAYLTMNIILFSIIHNNEYSIVIFFCILGSIICNISGVDILF